MQGTKIPCFGPVAPIHILEDLSATRAAGLYHLFLAHHTAANEDRFRQLICTLMSAKPYSRPTFIMDNSLVECGYAVDMNMVRDASRCIKYAYNPQYAEVISVLPDVMGDAQATQEATEAAFDSWCREMPDELMLVAQPGKVEAREGFEFMKTEEAWKGFTDLVNHFFLLNREKYRRITWIGLPRYLNKVGISRRLAVEYVQMVAPWLKIHLLGFSENILDDMYAARVPGVSGIDSAVPVRYNGKLTPMTREEEIGPRKDWMENGKLIGQNVLNIQNVRKWIGG